MKENLLLQLRALIYPVRCPVCGKIIFAGEDFCEECRNKLPVYYGELHISKAERAIAAFEYTPDISPAILLMKDGIIGNAAYALGKALAERIESCGISKDADCIIPVPMHISDMKKRGFNQSQIIAKEIGKRLNIEVFSKAVIKKRKTSQQKTLNESERRKNLRDAFSVLDHDIIRHKNILLIDDVCTTGSTLAEIAALLLDCGADKIYCASCCAAVKNKEVKNNE